MYLHAKKWCHIEPVEFEQGLVEEAIEVLERAVAVGIGIHREEVDERNTRLSVQVTGVIDEVDFEDFHATRIRVSNAVCPTCTRRAGNYFEATVQLRSSGRRLNGDELSRLRRTFDEYLASIDPDPMFFINREGEVTGGYDLVLGSKALARGWTKHLLKRFGGTSKETNSVVGRKDGEDLTRLTISYRKPAFEIGDVIRRSNRYWLVSAWLKDGAVIAAVDRNERSGVTWRDLEKTNVVSRISEQHDVDVLRRDSAAIEFMDPLDWKVKTVALPHDDDGEQTEIRIAFIADGWVALPRCGGVMSDE